jgi:hypothetical protein
MARKCAEAGGKTPPRASAAVGVMAKSACSVVPARNGVTAAQAARPEAGVYQRTDAGNPARSHSAGWAGQLLPPASAVRAGKGRACNRAARTAKMFCAAKDL